MAGAIRGAIPPLYALLNPHPQGMKVHVLSSMGQRRLDVAVTSWDSVGWM